MWGFCAVQYSSAREHRLGYEPEHIIYVSEFDEAAVYCHIIEGC